MTLLFDTKDWGWSHWQMCRLHLTNPHTSEGFKLSNINDVVWYLTYYRFANDYVSYYAMQEAVFNCATELGCVYSDIDELERDIRRYYI